MFIFVLAGDSAVSALEFVGETYRQSRKRYLPFWIVAVGTGPPLAPIRKSSGSDS